VTPREARRGSAGAKGGWGWPRERRFFRVIEPEGGNGIHPPAGVGSRSFVFSGVAEADALLCFADHATERPSAPPRRAASGWADPSAARLRVTRGRSTESGADGGDTEWGWGSPRAGRPTKSRERRFFRVSEPEGSAGIRPPAGVGRGLRMSRFIRRAKAPPLHGPFAFYLRGLNFTPGENSQECFGR
jgi:hypothetical protein